MDKITNILFVIPWDISHPGGVNQVVQNMYFQNQKNGGTPLILTDDWDSLTPAYKKISEYRSTSLRLRSPASKKTSITNFIKYIVNLPHSIIDISKLLNKNKITIINPHFPSLASFTFCLMKMLGLFSGQIIFSFHGLDLEHCKTLTKQQKFFYKKMLDACNKITTCSENLKEEFISIFPEYSKKVQSVPNGIEPSTLNKTDAPLSITSLPPYIVSVGTLEHKKGQDVLIKAYCNIIKKHNISLIIIGRTGPMEKELTTLIDELGINSNVKILQNLTHKQTLEYIKHSEIFCLPSRIEPFGIVILEAGFYSKPVIASKVGGIKEIIKDGSTGILVKPDNINELEIALSEVIENKEKSRVMGEALRAEVIAHYSWKKGYNRLLS
jgi:glycosyltransferase involved in cell wall biosynthesis